NNRRPRVHTDTDMDGLLMVYRTPFVKVPQAFEHLQGGVDSAIGVMSDARHLTKNCHQAVAYVFVNMAMMAHHNIGHQGKIVIQGLRDLLQLSVRNVGGKTHDVRHEYREKLALPTKKKRPSSHVVAIDPAEDTLHRFFGIKAFEHRVTTADQMSIAELFRQVEGCMHRGPGVLFTTAVDIELRQFQRYCRKLTGTQTVAIQVGRLMECCHGLSPLAHGV